MAITQTWKINRIAVRSSIENLTDIVSEVQWEIVTEEPNISRHVANGLSFFGKPDPASFTEYNSLTEEQVLEWVKTQLGATELLRITTIGYDYVANQLTTIEDRGLPWASTTSTNETTTI